MVTTNPQHTVVSFEPIRMEGPGIARVFELAQKWNAHFGLVPTLMGTEHDAKLIKFANSARKVQERGFSEQSSFSIFSLPTDVKHELEGYNSHFMLDFRYKGLIIDLRSFWCGFLGSDFVQMVNEFAKVVLPVYGFAFERPFDLGPTYFAMGAEKGDITDEEGESIAGQVPGAKFGYFTHGFIRDIFQWNCVSAPHLARKIEGTTLERWIRAQEYRGRLEPFVADTWTWQVEEKNIARVRRELKGADIIFNHLNHLQIPADYYHAQAAREGIGYENVAARVFLELGIPTKIKPAPKLDTNIFVQRLLPPTTPEETLRGVLEMYGYESEEEARVIKSLGEGKTKELSKEEIKKIMQKKKGKKPGK